MNKIQIRIFADPMMGLHWQLWPVLRKLLVKLDTQIDLDFMPVELVKNVYDFVDQNTLMHYGKKVALNTYWTKLMQIYLQEQQIAGMPIIMGSTGVHLFDEEHVSSRNLILAYLAVRKLKPQRQYDFLYAVQKATVLQDRQTTDIKVLNKIANKYDISDHNFMQFLNSKEIKNEFNHLQSIAKSYKLKQLPSVTITYKDKTYLANALLNYQQWLELLEKITGKKLKEKNVTFDDSSLEEFFTKFETISEIELREIFDENDVDSRMAPLLEGKKVKKSEYWDVDFYTRINDEK